MKKEDILNRIKGGLIVSCQMEKHAPGYRDDTVISLVEGAVWAGAVGLRINGIENIKQVRAITDLPIIGLKKVFSEKTEVFMTPTVLEVKEVIEAGADIVAIDGTDRLINGEPAWNIIPKIKKMFPEIMILADVRDDEDALKAIELGADFVAPTFYRFKKDAKSTDLPDWEMFAKMCRVCKEKAYVLMEGKIWTVEDAIRSLHYGAYAVVVGSAITRPHIVARRFVDHINGFQETRGLFY